MHIFLDVCMQLILVNQSNTLMLLLKEEGHIFGSVCLFMCMCVYLSARLFKML